MLLTAITFFIILSLLIFVHELGHYLVARIIGVGVEEFGFGLPPRIWGKKVKGTIYSINWLPIGGFVKLAGEDEHSAFSIQHSAKLKANSKRLKAFFWARSKKERAAILIAGVCMNFLLAVGITSYLLNQGYLEYSGKVRIEKVSPSSPADKAGMKVGDMIKTFMYQDTNSKTVEKNIMTSEELIALTKAHSGQEVTLKIIRDEHEQNASITPRKNPPQGEGAMGVAITDLEFLHYPSWPQAIWVAARININLSIKMITSLGSILWDFVQRGTLKADVAGPIGIAQVTGQAVHFGLKAVLKLVSLLSLNLAILNILPFPALDGGRLAFVFLEKILGRKVRPAFERSTHQIGMIILFALILLVSIHDILRFARGGGLTP